MKLKFTYCDKTKIRHSQLTQNAQTPQWVQLLGSSLPIEILCLGHYLDITLTQRHTIVKSEIKYINHSPLFYNESYDFIN